MSAQPKKVKPDSKGRITLGKLAEGVSSYAIKKDKHNRIILEPYTEIPVREKWVYENKKVHNKLKRGIKDAGEGKASSRGSFSEYTEDDSE